jgi:hypothetical protein
MKTLLGIAAVAWSLTASAYAAPPITLGLDHAWIAVAPGAPERVGLERAGFRIAPTVNRHEGQGTASVTVEFENGFLELLWPDDTVSTAPELQVAKDKFVARSNWRTTGWSPFAVGLHRTATTPPAFPFETWKVSAAWMGPGQAMEMLTPRPSHGVSLFVPAQAVDEAANRVAIAKGGQDAAMYLHPNGARRLTALRIVSPNAEGFPPSADFIRGSGALALDVGPAWLMDVTLDAGRRKRTADLRPDLPLVIHY